jgi:hypothetical protein
MFAFEPVSKRSQSPWVATGCDCSAPQLLHVSSPDLTIQSVVFKCEADCSASQALHDLLSEEARSDLDPRALGA